MMTRRLSQWLMICAGLLVCATAFALTPLPSDQERIVNTLSGVYGWALKHPGSGLEADRARLDLFLTPTLIARFEQAEVAEANYFKAAAPGEKPFLLEGDVIVGNVEGATEVAIGEALIDGTHATVAVTIIQIDERYSKAHRNRVIVWTDSVELELADNVWRVSDILYRSDPEQRLSTSLREYAEGQ